ncbi:STAS domain-containing protein [Phormidesmis sp. 146-35]
MNPTIKVLYPSGILNSTQADLFNQEINSSLSTGVRNILVDFKEVSFMDSSGLGLLIVALKTVKAEGGKLSLCSVSNEVKIVFELTDVEQFFEIFSDRDSFERSQPSSLIS